MIVLFGSIQGRPLTVKATDDLWYTVRFWWVQEGTELG
jgi:hypothetical protein